jgi:hypothetical protein
MKEINSKMQKYIYINLAIMTAIIFFIKLFKVPGQNLIIILVIIIGSIVLIALKKRLEKK